MTSFRSIMPCYVVRVNYLAPVGLRCFCSAFSNEAGIQLVGDIFSGSSVVQWSEFLAIDSEIPGSITGATRFSEK
jgi:hypothetical protein